MQKLQKLIIPVVTKFNTKLSNISNRVTSKKTKLVETEKQLNNLITSYTKLTNTLAQDTSQVSTKVNIFYLLRSDLPIEITKIIFVFYFIFQFIFWEIKYLLLHLHLN